MNKPENWPGCRQCGTEMIEPDRWFWEGLVDATPGEGSIRYLYCPQCGQVAIADLKNGYLHWKLEE